MRNRTVTLLLIFCFVANVVRADPCGMVPPIFLTNQISIERVGLQKTYVFYKNGVETFVIRPGYRGKVDNFGMLIPFPTPPEIRKVPDDIFAHVAAAVDPPEVVVHAPQRLRPFSDFFLTTEVPRSAVDLEEKTLGFDQVEVLREEAVGMYEVAVLEAGSARALKRWMDDQGYQYPDGMDGVCDEYVASKWCFVAVKTRVGNKGAVNPRPGQRDVDATLPPGSTFDGNVQAMGFRFRSDELVVPMRLSAFNAGDTRNVMYVLTDEPQRVNNIPEEYVVRQISGQDLYNNLTRPLPLRIIGGGIEDVPDWRRQEIAGARDPGPHNGLAGDLFVSDIMVAKTGVLSHPFEEAEKELLRISERLNLRGKDVDRMHAKALESGKEKTVARFVGGLVGMTLTVVDGDFPRDVLKRENLTFSSYRLDESKNNVETYDANIFGPQGKREGTVLRKGGLLALPFSVFLMIILVAVSIVLAGRLVRNRLGFGTVSVNGSSRGTRRVAGLLAVIVPLTVFSGTSAAFAEVSVVGGLIAKLGDRAQSDAAIRALVALGEEAVTALFDEAVDGTDPARRGWAIVCLGEIGGERVDRGLAAMHQDGNQDELVRSWAGAARARFAKTLSDLIQLRRTEWSVPVISLPIEKCLTGMNSHGVNFSLEDLLRLSMETPHLKQLLTASILGRGVPALMDAVTSSKNQPVRRQAAAYLVTLALQEEKDAVVLAVADAYRFVPGESEVPWHGGPLFVPSISWSCAEARALTESLLEWMLFCERKGLTAEKMQIENNLTRLEFYDAAGYRPPFCGVTVATWLRVWRNETSSETVLAMLEEQGVHEDPKYQAALK